MKQLTLFQDRLPVKPYHTDDFANGLSIAKAQQALKSRYIQPNGPTHKYWLVFDVDTPTATMDWYDLGAPAPNITAANIENGHAHLIYGLEVSIRTAPDGKSKPLRYAAAVENALRDRLGADIGYSGLICKNPLHAHWRIATWENNLYTLDWLADYLDLSPYNNNKRLPDYGLGRNCNLFEYLSKWSYKAIRQGWPDYEQWFEACFTRALGYNKQQFRHPLPINEVKHTAKSVARWTHKHFSPAAFSAWQATQGAKGGKAGTAENKAKAGSLGGLSGSVEAKAKAGSLGGLNGSTEDKAKAGLLGGSVSKGGGRPSNSTLSKTELEQLIVKKKEQGLSNRVIAEDLSVSASTVSLILRNLSK